MKPTTETVPHNGAIRVSDMIDGHLITRTYYGFTEREALALFIEEQQQSKTKTRKAGTT